MYRGRDYTAFALHEAIRSRRYGWFAVPPTKSIRPPLARGVICQRQRQQDAEPEQARADGEPVGFGAVEQVHEKEGDQQRLDDGDGEADDGVPSAEVEERD